MKTMTMGLLIALAAATLPAAAQTTAAYTAPAATPPADARTASLERMETLGMGDMVRVTVFRNPDLTTEARVSERGTILFPMLGEVPLAGLTPSQAGQRIAQKLRDG